MEDGDKACENCPGGINFGPLMAAPQPDLEEVARRKALSEMADTLAVAQMSAQIVFMLAEAYSKLGIQLESERTRLLLLDQITLFAKLAKTD